MIDFILKWCKNISMHPTSHQALPASKGSLRKEPGYKVAVYQESEFKKAMNPITTSYDETQFTCDWLQVYQLIYSKFCMWGGQRETWLDLQD